MPVGSKEKYDEAKESLQRMQEFDPETLPRVDELGAQLNFSEAVGPATELIELFKRLSIKALDDFPDNMLDQVLKQANNAYNIFSQALEFSVDQDSPGAARSQIVEKMRSAYPPAFAQLHPLIAYSLHRAADFQRLDTEARATLQSIEDKAESFSKEMQGYSEDAQRVLEQIRNVAAEEGVSQQAVYFRTEAAAHDAEAGKWLKRIVWLAVAVGVFAIASLFLHKIPLLVPESVYDTVQLAISKLLIFSVLAYMLFVAARNYLSHKHNAVVNKHRQNALMTHKALVEAAVESGVREAIMLQAASCIFTPQATGYVGQGPDGDGAMSAKSIVEILSKPLSDAGKG